MIFYSKCEELKNDKKTVDDLFAAFSSSLVHR